VLRTRVGYTGGSRANPTYHRLGDHTEALQVDFDPAKVSYAELLKIFFDSHDADSPPYGAQYRSAIWPGSVEQTEQARRALELAESKARHKLYSAIEPLGTFTLAEDYHQKYYLRSARELMRAFEGYAGEALAHSRVAARLNGVLGRCADPALIAAELPRYGLSPELAAKVQQLAGIGPRRLP
jgi:peptide-methionine (S)-S-oxide reductase